MAKTSDPKIRSGIRKKLRTYKHENFKKKKNRVTAITYYILTFLVIAALVLQAIEGNYENCFTCALTLVLFLIPNFVETRLKITLPQTLEVIVILFILYTDITSGIAITFPFEYV